MWQPCQSHAREPRDGRRGAVVARGRTEGTPALACRLEVGYNGCMGQGEPLRARSELPLPPRINQQHATVQGRRVLSRASREYKKAVARAVETLRTAGVITDEPVEALRLGFVGLFNG